MRGSRAELEDKLAECLSVAAGNIPPGIHSVFLQMMLRFKAEETAERIRRELARRDKKRRRP